MGRKNRKFVEDGIYHLIQRGHNKAYIFNEQIDKVVFLDMIQKTRENLPFHVLYYVLMDNHFHLIVQLQTAPIEKAMQSICLAYSKYFNKKYGCSGSIYGQRYRAYPVDSMRYLLKLILYIANNPVKAGLVKHPSEYRWCAHKDVVSRRSRIVSLQKLFENIGGSAENGARIYKDLIRQKITAVSQASTESALMREHRIEQLEIMLEEIVGDRSSPDHIRSGSRDALTLQIRREFILLAIEQWYKTSEIAQILNIPVRTVRAVRASG